MRKRTAAATVALVATLAVGAFAAIATANPEEVCAKWPNNAQCTTTTQPTTPTETEPPTTTEPPPTTTEPPPPTAPPTDDCPGTPGRQVIVPADTVVRPVIGGGTQFVRACPPETPPTPVDETPPAHPPTLPMTGGGEWRTAHSILTGFGLLAVLASAGCFWLDRRREKDDA